MECAIELVENDLPVRKAAENCSIPYETLRRKLKAYPPKKAGRKEHFSSSDEKILVEYAKFQADTGAPTTSKYVLL
jgi:hypothetical protein